MLWPTFKLLWRALTMPEPVAPIDRIEVACYRLAGNEGGYVDHPDDAGGPTNYGITIPTLERWWRRSVTADDIRALSQAEAVEIYRNLFVAPQRLDRLRDDGVFQLVLDMAVLHGISQAITLLQEVLGARLDGVLGPETLRLAHAAEPVRLINRLTARRLRFIGRLITRKPSQAAFADGWIARATAFLV